MPVVDREQLRAAQERRAAAYAKNKDKDGHMGAVARSVALNEAYDAWIYGEIERGTKPEDVAEAFAQIMGCMVSAMAQTTFEQRVVGIVQLSAAICDYAADGAMKTLPVDVHEGGLS